MDSNIEEIIPGITRQLLDDDTIALIISADAERHKVDVWAQTVIDLMTNWPKDRPYIAVYDVSQSAITPYTRKKSEEVAQVGAKVLKDHPVGYALVLPSSVLGNIMRVFVQRDIARRYPMWEVGVFTKRDDAVAWARHVRTSLNAQLLANGLE